MNAKKHGVSISMAEKEQSCVIQADRDMIQEVIYNLCDNAIRYNKEDGHVQVSVKKNKDNITLEVKDDGIGIPKKTRREFLKGFTEWIRQDPKRQAEPDWGLPL